jgi:putative ABC transport system permease protein
MVCTFGLLSLLVAVPVGMGIAYLSAQFVGAFLNIDFVDFWLPPWVLGLEVGTALAVPVLASLIPILAGTRTTVREAVSDYGINSLLKSGLLDRALMRIRRLPRPTLLSLRNTVRRKGRLFLTLGTLTLAGTIFTGVLNVRASLMRELDAVMRLYGFDIQMYLDNSAGILQLEREALRVPGVEHAEGWTFARAERIRPDDTEGSTFTILGPPADTPFIEPTLLEGRWLEPGDQNAIVLGSDLLKDEPDIHVGDEIMLEINEARRRWQVVGIINTGLESGVAYADYGYLSHVVGMPGRSWVLFAGTAQHDQAFQAEAARALEERLKRSGIDVSQSLTLGEIIGANVGQFNFLIGFMMFMAILLAIVGGLGLTSTMSLNVLERTREIGVMRATGASNRAVRGVVVTEGTVIGFLSWMLAAPLSVPLGAGMCAAVGAALFERPMPLSFSVAGVWIWLAIVLIISTLASLVPAARAARISVREALAYE